jgi:hypothetical protein
MDAKTSTNTTTLHRRISRNVCTLALLCRSIVSDSYAQGLIFKLSVVVGREVWSWFMVQAMVSVQLQGCSFYSLL